MNATRYILAGTLIDGTGQPAQRQVYLSLRDGIITGIGKLDDLPEVDPAAITDLSHGVLMPALVDSSVFLRRSPALSAGGGPAAAGNEDGHRAKLLATHLDYCRTYGVLGLAEADPVTPWFKRNLPAPATGSPLELRIAGHHDFPNTDQPPAEGDFIRLQYTADIEVDQDMPASADHERLHRVIGQAGGRKVIVAANGSRPVAEALAAGCHAIEQGYGMGPDNLARMAETGVLWIPRLLRAKNGLDSSGSGGEVSCRFSQRYVAPGKPNPRAEAFWKEVLADQLAQLRLARKLRVTAAVGTGAGHPGILHGEAVTEELKLFLKAGYTLEEAFCCGSENGARFFGMERLGALVAGRPATFLFTRGVASQLPRKLIFIEGLYVKGTAVSLKNGIE